MQKIILVNKRIEKPGEPYCGPITYCAISGTNTSKVESLHRKGRIKPSLGFFYLSFIKLNKNTRAFVEKNGSMTSTNDTKCFDSMWKFEERFQKITKKQFVDQTIKYNKELFKKNIKNISVSQDMSGKYASILRNGIKSGRALGAMIMNKRNRSYFIPHWITIHGMRTRGPMNEYLIFDPYVEESMWWTEKKLFRKMELNRKYGFSPQIVLIR